MKSSKLSKLYGEIAGPMLSTPPFSLGYPSDVAQSAYYPGPEAIGKDEIAAVSMALEQRLVFPENTRIRKAKLTGTSMYEVLQASIEDDVHATEFSLPNCGGVVRFLRGDHSAELTRVCSSLNEAANYAANENQRTFISQYVESFRTGDLHVYRNSQRTWIRDKTPHVENIFGFVEPYRDPSGIRAEFEGLVAISDTEETEILTKLVEHSATFIRRLPWANENSAENDGKGPFEKALFEPPDFTSIHGMYKSVQFERRTHRSEALAYCSSIIFPGINLPNVSFLHRI